MKEIQVGLGERSYPILIKSGILAEVGADLSQRRVAKRYVVISDDRVGEIYGQRLLASLAAAGLAAEWLTFPHGEAAKNLATIATLASQLARLGIERRDALIALGGGVTGDLTGFLASSYMRGIPFVQIPTSLLAQVDSSVGGKTGVDLPEGKNLVGAFYQPRCVYIDSLALTTLPGAELLNGLAEAIKYGVIYDPDFFAFLEVKRSAILALEAAAVEETIARSCTIKAAVVAKDEKEADLRRILNFGHTIGHAVEGASDYTIAHGAAVAIGMVAAARIAVAKALFPAAAAERLRTLIAAYGLPSSVPAELDRARIRSYLTTDKKSVGGRPFFILPTAIGEVVITNEVESELIEMAIAPA